MRKKFLLMLTLLILALGGSGKLFAADGNVAKVGNTEYATIDEAIAAWTDKTTLTLLADVTLSDVIKLSSTEYHILDLGTYTMTAASGKDAIQYVVNGRSSASYALDIKADANNPGGIIATGKAIVVHEKPKENAPEKDRPITRFYGGVFEATDIVKQYGWERFMFVTFREGVGYSGAKAPYFYFYGGEFNGNISTNRSSVQFHGGTFNGFLNMSVDSSSWAMVEGGKFKYLSNLMGSNLDEKIAQGVDNYKFTIGSAKALYDRGIYVDKDGYYVITSAPITEVSAKYPAVYKTNYDGDNYFYYSAAQEYGMFYEDAAMAPAGSTIWEKPAVTIPENVEGDAAVVEEIKNNTALNGYTPENLPEGAELEIVLVSVGETFVYDVTPMANGSEVDPTEAIIFRLPVPASVTETLAKVYHEGTLMGVYDIKGEGNAKYVKIASADFSEFAIEPITHYEVATYEALINALANDGAYVIMTDNITATATQSSGYGKAGIVVDAGDVLDGNSKTLTINGAGATWDCAIAMRGGEVKNLTIAGAMRGVFMPGANGDVVIDNCVFKNVVYTFNSDAGSKNHTVTIKNTTLNGWTSFSNAHKAVVFESCEFGEGSGYAFCRPYQATTFVGCAFNKGYEFDTSKAAENSFAFNDCTYNGEALRAENKEMLNMFYNGGSVVIDGEETNVTSVAKIGNNRYLSLEEAAQVAQTGETITMLADATLSEKLTLPAGIILNGNGKQINGEVWADGNLTFVGHTKVTTFNAGYNKPTITIGEGACLEMNGSGRMVIGHGATFNITGTIEDAKAADKATLVPSLKIAAGASITGNGVTFNVNNAYIVADKYCSSKNSNANGTFNFNINNSIWNQTGNLQFSEPTNSMDPTVNFKLTNSVLTTTGHLIFSVSKGEIVIDNSLVNQGSSRQIENRSTMTIKNGSVVNGAVATSENAKNPGTVIVENATYAVTGEFSGSNLGTGTLVIKKGANVSVGSIKAGANVTVDATGMVAGDEINFTANLSQFTGELSVINNDKLEAKIVDGKIVLVAKPVAQIGEQKYATLYDAVKVAKVGDKITLLGDADLAFTDNPMYNNIYASEIDLNGKTLTIKEGDLRFDNVTIKNGNIIVQPGTYNGTAIFLMYSKNLTFNDVKVTATGVASTYLIGLEGESNLVLENNSEIVIKNESLLTISSIIADNGNGNEVTINNSKIDIENTNARLYLGGTNGNITVENSDIDLNGVKDGFYLRAGQTLAITGNSTVDITLNSNEGRYGINLTDITATYTKDETATVNATVFEVPAVAMIGTAKYASLQAAIDKVNDGETVVLVSDCAEVVSFTQTADKSFVIDGNNKIYTGSINITARAGKDAPSTLVIKNFNFNTDAITHDFIKSVETNYYPNNITISGCKFNGTTDINTTEYAVVAVRLKSANNIKIENCTGSGLHSFLQNTAGWNIQIDNVDVTNSLSGFAMGTVQGANIKNCDLVVNKSGIRFDAQLNNNAVITDNEIQAFIPVVVRKASYESTMTFNGENTFTATNTDGLWCAIGTSEYGENGQMPTAATGNVSVTLNDAGLNADGIYGNSINFEGSGTEESPYLINNLNDLKFFRNNVDKQAQDGSTQYAGKYFKLTADIDLAGINWNPIGSMSGDHGSFKGVFDGDNNTISNLKVEQAGNGIGLFARTTGNAVIKNLKLNNVTVKSTNNSDYVGGVVGNAYASTKIENVHISGDVQISGKGYIGGIVGHGYVVMDDVSVVANEGSLITSTFWCAGGILGYAGEGTTNIMNANVEGLTITSAAGGLGSIVGMAEDNNGTQPISGSNLSAKGVEIKTYVGGFGTAYENYCIGYLYGGNKTSKLTGELKVENVVLKNASGNFPSEVSDAVANINGKIYFNLADAIATIDNGDVTINLLRDATLDYNARDEYGKEATTSVTINGNNHTLTLNQTNSDWASIGLVNGKLVLNNMTIEKTGYGDTSGAWNTHAIIFSTDVVMNNVTVNNAIAVAADATLENVTINEANGYYGLWIEANGQTVTMNGGSITATNGGRGIKIADQYIDTPKKVKLNVTGTKFTTAKKAAVLVSSEAGAKITAENVDITNVVADNVNFVWVDEDWAANYGNVEVTGAEVEQEGIENFVAAISNTQDQNTNIIAYYKTLPEAIAAVQAGETIELIANVEASEVIMIGKNVTINGNNKKVTSNANRVFRVTVKDTEVTLNNVNMVNTKASSYTADIRGISVDDVTGVKLTLNNCSVDFTDESACDWSYAVNVVGGSGHVINVNGGTYEGANVINVHGANNTIDVQGATLTSLYLYSESYYGACIYVAQDQNSSVTATGNTFNGSNAVAFNVGYTPVTESNNTDNTTRIIAKIGEEYYTLQEAIEAAGTTPTTITIMASFSTDDSYTIAAGQNITLNLNGKTITGTDNATGSFGLINNKGTLKIVDGTRAGGAITLKANVDRDWNAYSSVISNQPGGKLTVEGGTIEHLGGTDMAYGIDNLTNGKGTYAETEIKGGTVKSTYRAIRQFLNGIEAQNILTVKGGTIVGTNKSIWMQDPSKNANTGTLIVNANANLYGDVYLSVTEGSTEWPVEVAIVADAIKQGTVLTSNVPEGYLLVAENGLYTVETIKVKEQTINLNNGWTWVSLFVDATGESGLESFENQLEQYNADNQIVQIKNQTKAVTYQSYYGNYGWYGNLKSLAVNDMYMVKIEKDNVVVELEDYKVNPADYEFNLVSGWTWLGFPSTSDAPVAIEYALQNITPNKGDQIKSQEGFATYTNNKWYGNLSSMTPGMGYMYKNNSDNTVTLKYPAEVNYRGVAPANITAKNNLMVPNMSKYANNMSIIAVVNIDGEELMTEDFEVAVFAGEELRGSARPIYVEDFNSYMLFLTVYGEASEELTFKYYDLNSGEELNLFADSKVVFEINSTVGSLEEALVLNYGTLSIDETSLNGFNVYPNPVNRDNAISFETTFDKVEVYNSLGVVVAEYANVDQIDGIDAAGIYVIKVTNDNVVKYCRVIVK